MADEGIGCETIRYGVDDGGSMQGVGKNRWGGEKSSTELPCLFGAGRSVILFPMITTIYYLNPVFRRSVQVIFWPIPVPVVLSVARPLLSVGGSRRLPTNEHCPRDALDKCVPRCAARGVVEDAEAVSKVRYEMASSREPPDFGGGSGTPSGITQ